MATDVGKEITLASGALLTLNRDGTFTYNPKGQFEALNDGETGNDSFTYTISDGNGATDTATVNITLNGVTDNLPPDAVDDNFTTDEDNQINNNVLLNDSNSLTVTEVNGVATDVGKEITLASGALLTLNIDGTFTYNPKGQFEALNDGETGNDSFTYTISDGNGNTDTATVNITINGVTDDLPPDAIDDSFATNEDQLLNDNVLLNDSDIFTVTEVNGVTGNVGNEITLASGALLTLNSDGTFTYNPNGQFEALNDGETGNDSFTYTISDGNGNTDTATVNIIIDGVTQEPTPILINANNPGFEKGSEDWYLAKTGRANTYGEIRVVENGQSYSGQKQLYLKLPRQAISNYDDQISIGQDLSLSNQKRYAVEVYVKWLNPNNSLPSAIISLWARHPDQETFSGKDFHIVADADGQTEYERLRFEFTPNEDGEVRVWLGLSTHIDGLDDTEVYVDNFRIIEIGDAIVDKDTRTGNLIVNGDFSQNSDWQITRNNPRNVEGLIQSIESDNLRLELPGTDIPDYLNNTWAGVYQTVKLYEGVTYELSADFDRDVPLNDQTRTIINVYAYRPPIFSDTGELILDEEWIGPIDYDFDCSQPGDTCINDNHCKTFTFTPTETAEYIITFRVFGWANNGVPVKVDIDNVDLRVQP